VLPKKTNNKHMKKNIFLSAIIISCLLLSCTGTDNESAVKNALGTWEYTVPEAPYEYQNGVVTFEMLDGKLTGYFVIQEKKMELQNIIATKDHVNFQMNLEGENISFDLKMKKKSFSGTVSYSEGKLDIFGKRKS